MSEVRDIFLTALAAIVGLYVMCVTLGLFGGWFFGLFKIDGLTNQEIVEQSKYCTDNNMRADLQHSSNLVEYKVNRVTCYPKES